MPTIYARLLVDKVELVISGYATNQIAEAILTVISRGRNRYRTSFAPETTVTNTHEYA